MLDVVLRKTTFKCVITRINFIRLEKHLFGTTPWSAYEKARELHRLHNDEDYSIKRLQSLTKLSSAEIRNKYSSICKN